MHIRYVLGVLLALTAVSASFADTYNPFVPYDTNTYDKTQTIDTVLGKVSATENWPILLQELAQMTGLSVQEVEDRLRNTEYDLVKECVPESGCKFKGGGVSSRGTVGYFVREPLEGEMFACIGVACVSSVCANPGTLIRETAEPVSTVESGCVVGEPTTSSYFIQTPGFHVHGFGVGPSAITGTQTSQSPACVFKGEK